MTIQFIASITPDNGLGRNNELLYRIKKDLQFFKELTTTSTSSLKNVVVMGMKTWNSIPEKYRPLPDRINIVLTRQIQNKQHEQGVLFMNFEQFKMYYKKSLPNTFVIGGAEIYNLFLKEMPPQNIYLTHIYPRNEKCIEPDTYFPEIHNYKDIWSSEIEYDTNNNVDFLIKKYRKNK